MKNIIFLLILVFAYKVFAEFDTGLRGDLAKIMSGYNNGIAGGKVADFTLLVTPEEEKHFNDTRCFDENECYTDRKFYKFIVKKYPDIGKIKFPMTKELREYEKEDLDKYRYDFYNNLYLAKRITLANGQSLFDFMTKCSKSLVATDFASYDPDSNIQVIQFFPVLRIADTGEPIEMDIIFDRLGDEVKARSPWFSTHIMQDSDFLKQHGLRCYKK